jgi:hypothetical protein
MIISALATDSYPSPLLRSVCILMHGEIDITAAKDHSPSRSASTFTGIASRSTVPNRNYLDDLPFYFDSCLSPGNSLPVKCLSVVLTFYDI